nr:hypothetical protein StreXyl84_76370 [Streptomyces sp. Xyl84]
MRRTERLPAAIRTVRDAATAVRTSARPQRVRPKTSVADARTRTDRQVERLIRRRPATGFPGEAILGEEGGGPWDRAAGALPVREAGGAATTGEELPRCPGDGTTVAGDARVHEAVPARPAAVRAAAAVAR